MVVAELVRHVASVREMVLNPKNAAETRATGVVEAVTGDVRDRKTLTAALNGVESAFSLAPAFLLDEAEVGMGSSSEPRRRVSAASLSLQLST
jgi:uncharacterized protein YbjT (DUF2867 family)